MQSVILFIQMISLINLSKEHILLILLSHGPPPKKHLISQMLEDRTDLPHLSYVDFPGIPHFFFKLSFIYNLMDTFIAQNHIP